MNLDLRPLTVSEFLDRTFSIYRHRFLLVVGLMAPQAVLSLIVAMLMGWGQASLRTPQDFQIEHLTAIVVAVSIGAVLFTILHWVLYVLGAAAIASAVSDLYGRMVPDIGSSFAAAMRRLASLLWATFLMAVRVFGVWVAAPAARRRAARHRRRRRARCSPATAPLRPAPSSWPRSPSAWGRSSRSASWCSWGCATPWRYRRSCSSRSAAARRSGARSG